MDGPDLIHDGGTAIPPVLSPPSGRPARPGVKLLGRQHLTPGYVARLAIAGGAIIAWTVLGFSFFLHAPSGGGQPAPPPDATPQSTAAATGGGPIFQVALQQAREVCPQGQPVLFLDDSDAACELGDYFMYPGRITCIRSKDAFSGADLNGRQGTCLIYHGEQSAQRLQPFLARLQEITCVPEGCVYSIK